ncbi:transposase [Corynebacterium striatum]|nr:transposase [Corynebacterium striatum]
MTPTNSSWSTTTLQLFLPARVDRKIKRMWKPQSKSSHKIIHALDGHQCVDLDELNGKIVTLSM